MDSHSKMVYFFFQLFLSCVTCVVVVSSSSSSTASSLSSLSPHIINLNHSNRSEGCRSESNPGMFRRRGEVFFVGCDSKCVCTHSGVIQCEPRCSLFQGFDKEVCQLMPDPMDPECCTIAVCNLTGFDSTDKIREETKKRVSQTTAVILDSVQALNSTAAKVKVFLVSSEKSDNSTNNRDNNRDNIQGNKDKAVVDLQLLYMKFDSPPNLEWSRVTIHPEKRQESEAGSYPSGINSHSRIEFDFQVNILEPSTEYLMKVHELKKNLTSNTVVVRTFPQGIDTSFDGCFIGNKTYEIGQVFFDGCAYKCTCREGGIRECKERCPVYIDTIGYENCDWQPAPEDPCCTIPVCPGNGSSSPPPAPLPVTASSSETDASQSVHVPSPLEDKQGRFEKYEPETDSTSTASSAEASINASFHGCIIGNKTYEIGEIFFDGCAYKCTCREGGIRECAERCPVYIDTIGYENCDWQPAPEDSCCTIPVCPSSSPPPPVSTTSHVNTTVVPTPASHQEDKVKSTPLLGMPSGTHNTDHHPSHEVGDEPLEEAFCVSPSTSNVYSVDQSWKEGLPCLGKTCKCLLLPNKTTVIECEGGCGDIPSSALKASHDCPRPHLVQPQDPCLCPYVICNQSQNPINFPPRLPNTPTSTSSTPAPSLSSTPSSPKPSMKEVSRQTPKNETPPAVTGCNFRGKILAVGEEAYDGCRGICHCGSDLKLNCGIIECPHHFSPETSECLEWEADVNFVPSPPECCPRMKCKTPHKKRVNPNPDRGSHLSNIPYPPFAKPLGKPCHFAGMTFEHYKIIPTKYLPCEIKCMCINGNITCDNRCPSPSSSHHDHRSHSEEGDLETSDDAFCVSPSSDVYLVGQSWMEGSPCLRKTCKCLLLPNQTTVIECEGGCGDIPSSALTSSRECYRPQLIHPQDPCLCPYVVCNNVFDIRSLPPHLPNTPLFASSSQPIFKAGIVPTMSAPPPQTDRKEFRERPILIHVPIPTEEGCGEIPSSALRPSPDCPHPQLVQPQDPHLCPYVICNNSRNPINPPPRLPNSSGMSTTTSSTTTSSSTTASPSSTSTSSVSIIPSTVASVHSRVTNKTNRSDEANPPSYSLKAEELKPYYIALTIMAFFTAVTSIAFLSLLCIMLRSKSSAKAPITPSPSLTDQAYDNPSYKSCESNEHHIQMTTRNGLSHDHILLQNAVDQLNLRNSHHNNLNQHSNNHRNSYNLNDNSHHSNSNGSSRTTISTPSSGGQHLPAQIKINGLNGATIIGTAQV